jgi:hypothetical protein
MSHVTEASSRRDSCLPVVSAIAASLHSGSDSVSEQSGTFMESTAWLQRRK